MLLRLEAVLSWVGLITAIAYCLGWLKTLYYFDAFGIGLPALNLSPTESKATSLTGSELYLVHANERQLFVWDRSGFSFGRAHDQITIVVLSRDAVAMIETHKPHEIQPGSLFF